MREHGGVDNASEKMEFSFVSEVTRIFFERGHTYSFKVCVIINVRSPEKQKL